ncbi:ATP phosphoribosyltransferase [Roseibium aggregatum]|uniref:ATP phosphoribosyltransferase n=1 Tax=Roseibium aggregatum TaxID=187304 RepID=A0A939EA90_9HYPH|nr:ATP phosphoribosyltransferase [Roseibium aggregatum]MBN9669036.1 ATP phosphoribosyltransferase [Roseibium aggregatum]
MTKLIIAIPSKGRLQENTHEFFGRAGLKVLQPGGARNYRGAIKGLHNVEIAFLSASEIARALSEGSVHFGITGLDLVHENITDPVNTVHIVTPLGFGPADVVVAVPKAWIDVETMADLSDVASDFRNRHGRRLRVATKYVNLTRSFFAGHGIADYRIVESAGATEGAPAAGSAELIVDITTTGSTLQANNLKILTDGVMLKSQANLVASLSADWSQSALAAARAILDRVAAEEAARNVKLVKAQVDDRTQALRAVSNVGAVQRFADSGDSHRVNVLCPKDAVADCAKLLIEEGAETVTVETLDYVFSKDNPLFSPLKEKVGG